MSPCKATKYCISEQHILLSLDISYACAILVPPKRKPQTRRGSDVLHASGGHFLDFRRGGVHGLGVAGSFAHRIGALKIFDGLGPPSLPREAAAEAHQVERDLRGGAGFLVESERIIIGLLRGFEIVRVE